MPTNQSDTEATRLAEAAGAAFARRDFATSQAHARALLLKSPRDWRALLVLGLVAVETGDLAAAKRFLDLVKDAPMDNPSALNSLGAALLKIGDVDGARRAFAGAGAMGLADAWRRLGKLEAGFQNWDTSIAAYEKVIGISPGDAQSHAALARIFERRHDLAKAIAHASQAITSDPLNAVARTALGRALLRQNDPYRAEAAALPITQSEHASNSERSIAWGIVGDARDQAADAEGAFAAFAAANAFALRDHSALLGAAESPYHPAGIRRIIEMARRANVSSWQSSENADPLMPAFLVGFPRSGTTLLEQVLSAHPDVICLGEQPFLVSAFIPVVDTLEKFSRFENLTRDDIGTIRTTYHNLVRSEIGDKHAKVLVDKQPLNIVVLPLIKRIFPNAKIIFALRDPRDVVLSCFQHRFAMNPAMAQLLQLDTAAAYYDLVMQLMEVCRRTLCLDVHEVRYEDVVADLEGAARSVSTFLGVAYEPAMLNYRDTALKREITTPSMRQVTQPLYSRSVGRWRRYEKHLAPVLPMLAPWVARYHYQP